MRRVESLGATTRDSTTLHLFVLPCTFLYNFTLLCTTLSFLVFLVCHFEQMRTTFVRVCSLWCLVFLVHDYGDGDGDRDGNNNGAASSMTNYQNKQQHQRSNNQQQQAKPTTTRRSTSECKQIVMSLGIARKPDIWSPHGAGSGLEWAYLTSRVGFSNFSNWEFRNVHGILSD